MVKPSLKSLKKIFNPKFVFLLLMLAVLAIAGAAGFYLLNSVYIGAMGSLADLQNSLSSNQVINVDPIKSTKFEAAIAASLEKGRSCK